ncbi:hypothetical protein [Actinocorallia populi]|uniref:hypothetical protein n=1 Tax=Actinocorallia populi TaxID=2079200 RepID=UPI000D0956D0|nr:hypothetical protein [Actinocorallia populi]
MKSTTRNLICAITFAPVVALLAGAPAQAADDGPLAKLLDRDGAKGSAADLASPVLGPFPYLANDTVRSAGTSRVEAHRGGAHEATALLGPTSSEKYGLQAEGIASKCVTPAKGRSKGGTLIEEGRLQGRKLPEYPAVNQQVPLRDGAYAILNKQVRNAEGYTVIGTQFVDRDGKTTDVAKTRCVTPKKMMSAQRRVPGGTAAQEAAPAKPAAPDPGTEAVGNLLEGLVGGLMDMQGRLDTYMQRKSPVTLEVADELGEKVGEAAVPYMPENAKKAKAAPGAGPKTAPAPQTKKAAPKGQRRAMAAAEPDPKLLGNEVLNTKGDDIFDVLKGSGTNSGLKTSLLDEKKNKNKKATEGGLFGGLPGLSQLPANVTDLLEGNSA